MITDRLKLETKANHDETEGFSYAGKIMDASLNLEEYKQLILKNYLFHKAVESGFRAFTPLFAIAELDMESRMKTEALKADLELLGIPASPSQTTPVSFGSIEEALGYMYVVEGATLGGAYILKALKHNPNIMNTVNGFNYYGIYGDLIGMKWKTFQGVLLGMITTKEQEDQVIEAAKKAFDLFRDIFKGTIPAA